MSTIFNTYLFWKLRTRFSELSTFQHLLSKTEVKDLCIIPHKCDWHKHDKFLRDHRITFSRWIFEKLNRLLSFPRAHDWFCWISKSFFLLFCFTFDEMKIRNSQLWRSVRVEKFRDAKYPKHSVVRFWNFFKMVWSACKAFCKITWNEKSSLPRESWQ